MMQILSEKQLRRLVRLIGLASARRWIEILSRRRSNPEPHRRVAGKRRRKNPKRGRR
jgi:hypothetical protein